MKTKNKILLFTLILPFIIVVMVILSIKKSFNEETVPSQTYSEGIEAFRKSYDFADFEEISAEGWWNIHLMHDDHFKIEIVAPENMLDELSVEKTGHTLLLISEKKNSYSIFSFKKRPGINITLPSISKLDVKNGIANISISGFSDAETSISMEGIVSVTGEHCNFNQFFLSGDGIINIDMNDTPVANAHLEHSGIYNIMMLMDNGRLSGNLDGIGRMIASGEVFENSIRVDGPGIMKIIK